MENHNLNELIGEYRKAAHGEAKISAMKAAVRQADLEKDIRNQLQIRLDIVEESVFYGDTMDALVTFPQLLAMEEENSDFVDTYDVLWAFKWILTGATDFPQISLKEIDSYLKKDAKRTAIPCVPIIIKNVLYIRILTRKRQKKPTGKCRCAGGIIYATVKPVN